MTTALAAHLGLSVPVIQAPMAGVSTPEMAAAVSNAGGLGSVALGALTPDQAAAELEATRALTGAPIAANVFTHPAPRRQTATEQALLAALAPLFRARGAAPPEVLEAPYRSFNEGTELLEVLLDLRPEAVSLHFGPASGAHLAALKAAGIRVLATATSVREARLLEAAGVDGIVVQGFDAGGHSGAFLGEPDPASAGRAGLEALIQQVRAAVDLPVVAAGGLMDGADIAAVLAAGAELVQLGTAFIDCPESSASTAYRAALQGRVPTRLTAAISGRPARGLANRLLEDLVDRVKDPPDYPLTYDAVKRLIAAAGDPEYAVMWAGTGVGRTRALPAGALVRTLGEERDATALPGA